MTLPRRLSRYELVEEIGRGNMGVVYKAHDPVIDRTVAIKVVRLGFSLDDERRKEFLERFEREARIAGKLSHANIIAVHDVGLDDDEPYLVMEHFSGVDLGRLLRRGSVPEDEARRIISELADALAYAHRQGVVHRDIKPANVLYQEGGSGSIKLVDFGIAKLEASEATSTGEFMGTPSYMAPEIFSGERVDARTDLFSLGVLLYQLLTGTRPFDASSVSRTIYRVMHDDPEPPTRQRSGLTPAWDLVCARLLAKSPGDRYRSAESLRDDLDALGRGTLAASPTDRVRLEPTVPIGRLRVWAARARTVLPVAALLAGVVYFAGPGREAPSSEAAPAATVQAEGTVPDLAEPDGAATAGVAEAASTPTPTETEATHESPPPFESLRFVARHQHSVGHCTGDLLLGSSQVRFSSSRHEWRWSHGSIRSFERKTGRELSLVIENPDDDTDRFNFTFLRPAISRDQWERFERHRRR